MSSSPVVTACFQDGDALAIENARALPASSLNGWGFHLKDPESLRLGSDDLDRLLGGDRFLTEDSDLLKFLSIPTFMQSSSSELPRLDPSILHPKPESSNSFSSVEELTSQEMTENSSEVRTGQRGPLPVSYQAPIQEKTSTELCVGDNKTLGLTGSMHVGRDPFPIVTGVWDAEPKSPSSPRRAPLSRRIWHPPATWIAGSVSTPKSHFPATQVLESGSCSHPKNCQLLSSVFLPIACQECYPLDALQHELCASSDSQSQLSSVTRKPSSSHTIEKFESLDPNWTVKDAMPYRQSIGLSARPEFSASSEEEMITLETDASVSRFDEDNERSMRQSNQETLNTQTSINSSSSSTNTPMLQSCTHEALHQAVQNAEMGTVRLCCRCVRCNGYQQTGLRIKESSSSSEKNLVEPSDVTICEPESPSEIADHDEALDVDEDESDFAIEASRDQEFQEHQPCFSLAYDYTARKSQTPLGPEIDLPIAREEDSVKMNRKGRRGTTHTSEKKISPYPRVTRSTIEYSSTRGVVSSPSPTAPVSASGRGSRSTSTRVAQNGCLITSRRTLSQAHKSVQDDLSGTGPIMCGHVDDKTGEKCETMFKRPYDLARHKELYTIQRDRVGTGSLNGSAVSVVGNLVVKMP
ncbi:hypothetical protein H4Q26_008655 [Puccinia striiformis f. sp. tritici PST-130]|nr:hypothetical protein H4Q26_008655 [Puccinia striiformis f. sp. tritici PST-130]